MTIVTLRVERNGRFVSKRITQKMMCALFDLQFMMEDTWDTVKLNKMDKDLQDAFAIISHIDAAMHNNEVYSCEGKKFVKEKDKNYMFGKPNWRKK